MMRHLRRVPLAASVMLLHAGCKSAEHARKAADTGAAPARAGYVDADSDVRLFYRIVGNNPDTLVVIHGGPGLNMEYFADDFAPLADRHTLLFYDQRGTGRSSLVSDSSELDARRFADDLEALRRHFGMERLALLGHSWGAGVAALYATRFPERVGRLIIVGGIPLRRQGLVSTFQELDANRDSTTRTEMKKQMDARRANPGDAEACRAYYVLWFRPFFHDSTSMNRSKGDFCAGTAEARRNKINSVDRYTAASLGDWDWGPSLRAVTAPALIIHGTSDVIGVENAREWAAALPNSRLLLLEAVGHFPYVEAPERFFSAVDAFLRGRWPEGVQPISGR